MSSTTSQKFRDFTGEPLKDKHLSEVPGLGPKLASNLEESVSLLDEHPFENEFFHQIARSFSFMEELTVINKKSQKNKLYRKSKNDNQDLTIIKYLHMTKQNLYEAHYDYVEQFLVNAQNLFFE
ncbi:unnamed protein product [Rotaria sordida]|uniref:Uncharacterized protein n=1 Tax=Rotaria sordida TaxID=392033 RepID=A0A814XIG3_9BILA|nr:unnamed protein product [Rotaria sordida]